MLVCLGSAEEEILDDWMQFGQAVLLVCVGIIDIHVSAWRNNVELGIEDVDAIHDSVQAR